jgi:hypothetical protein
MPARLGFWQRNCIAPKDKLGDIVRQITARK